jgi:hypothetical protein
MLITIGVLILFMISTMFLLVALKYFHFFL